MAKTINNEGNEFNNIRETWNKNEKRRPNTGTPSTTSEKLERTIEEEASEYENANKEERLLSGDRASVDDESASEG